MGGVLPDPSHAASGLSLEDGLGEYATRWRQRVRRSAGFGTVSSSAYEYLGTRHKGATHLHARSTPLTVARRWAGCSEEGAGDGRVLVPAIASRCSPIATGF